LTLQFTYFTRESPKFLILAGNKAEARKECRKIYKSATTAYDANRMVRFIESHCQKTTSSIPVKEAFTSERHYRGSWVGMIVMMIHEFTGINAIMLYSN